MKVKVMRILLSIILGFVSYFFPNQQLIIFIVALSIISYDVIFSSIKNIFSGAFLDEEFLMSIAAIGSFVINEPFEGLLVMVLYQIGELFQTTAINRSRMTISSLMDLRPDYANLVIDGQIVKRNPGEIGIGNEILVLPGEKIAIDGFIVEGISSIDTSRLTGESLPRDVNVGDQVLSGSVNLSAVITVKTTTTFQESTASKILELVENSTANKAPAEKFITKFARYYTPIVVFLAIVLAVVPTIFLGDFNTWLYRALTFLVVSCPCALVISIPLSFFAAIGCCAKNNILVKGSSFIERLSHVSKIAFDKTGTLTKGNFVVSEINAIENKNIVLQYAASAEQFSIHPIALALKAEYQEDLLSVSDVVELPGQGIKACIERQEILCGNHKLMEENEIDYIKTDSIGTILYVALNKKFLGSIVISDQIKEGSKKALKDLKNLGIVETIMLTGDNEAVGKKIAMELDIDKCYTNLLPAEKVAKMEQILKEKKPKEILAYVGDGINDAPVLALSDLGIAMGTIGSDAAIEASDVVIMNDDLASLVKSVRISRKTLKIVKQNIVFAFGIKLIILILSAFGLTNMWLAIFADVGVCMLAILNAIHVLYVERD